MNLFSLRMMLYGVALVSFNAHEVTPSQNTKNIVYKRNRKALLIIMIIIFTYV
jgi:hypothetical protein